MAKLFFFEIMQAIHNYFDTLSLKKKNYMTISNSYLKCPIIYTELRHQM